MKRLPIARAARACICHSALIAALLVGNFWLGCPPCAEADGQSSPLDPAAGLASLHVPAGFRVDLVVAEPLVMDPVAFDWGPDGKLWVAEMLDYPLGLDGQGKPGGRICYLEDTDGDGRYDRRTEFLDGVAFPTGLMAWRDGVLVTASGKLFFARDTTGDGHADEQRVLFFGFNPGNQQHRVNGLRWGMDGWVYLANGDSGGQIKSAQTGEMVDISGRDLRVKPEQNDGRMETVSGVTQFGRDRDDWGHWFGSNNSNPGFQFVLEDRYLRRNRHLAPPAPSVIVVDPSPRLHPLSATIERFNNPQSANHYTSACGGTVYRDDLLGSAVTGNYFVCEPSHNLVERQSLAREGLVFHGTPADGAESHFLRSTDNWFRPVMCRTGPDGGLWVADMYRAVLEHPEWIPDDVEKQLDLRAGSDRGRIYRVVRQGVPLRPVPRVADLKGAALAAALDTPNGTLRDLVQRQIVWQDSRSLAAPLAALARNAQRPAVRAQALWTLDLAAGVVDEKTLLAALADREPAVRAQALELAGRYREGYWDRPAVRRAVAALVADPKTGDQADVQLQLAYFLGFSTNPESAGLLGKLLIRHASDPFLSAAALSSVNGKNVDGVLAEVLKADTPSAHAIGQLLAFAVAEGAATAVDRGVAAAATPHDGKFAPWQFAALASAFDAGHHAAKPLSETVSAETQSKLKAPLAAARLAASDDALAEADRAAAIGLLAVADERDANLPVLAELLAPQQSAAIQTAAVDALARSGDERVAGLLLEHWNSFSPALAARVLDALLSRDAWASTFLDQLAAGTIQSNELDAARRQQLLEHRSAELRDRAAKLLAAGNADRQKVIDQFSWIVDKPGDSGRGRAVFAKRCAACHRLEGQGFAVGADLAAVGNRSPQALLIAILDPNRAVEDRYVNYVAVDDDGRQFSGVLAAESGESLTLRGQEGKEQVLLRKNLETLRRTGKSPMPEGLERDMTGQDLADVIAYVGGVGPSPPGGSPPADSPAIARPAADGSLSLAAAAAQVEGPTIRLEEKYKNLGYWGSADDVARWSIELPAAGSFTVDVDYACDDATAGSDFQVAVAGHELTGKVASTGSWDQYRTVRIGQVDLPAGAHLLTLRSVGPPRPYLLDLRTIRLVPSGQ